MARWQITISGKGIQRRSVDKLAKSMSEEFKDCSISITDASPPESRADRFSAAMSLVSDAKSELEELKSELEDWHGNLPENFQSGSKGDEIQQAINEAEELEGKEVSFPGMY